jgi:hypothetical protein
MARCEVCGNDYDKSFNISLGNSSYDFDSFECAIAKLAPSCHHCQCKVIGHGVEIENNIFCCHHCAEKYS